MEKMIERLENDSKEMVSRNGMKTYIIAPERLENLLWDTKLLSALSMSVLKIKRFVEYTRIDASAIFFALVHFTNRMERYAWEPLNCYKIGDAYYPVYIRSTWLCRECKQLQDGLFLMPIMEYDFYGDTDNPCPQIPSIFKKRLCKNCGKPLQNYFLPYGNQEIIN
ncbi:MAG: hypothetical protein ACLUDG_03310 [Butyricicoccus sp.]